MTLADCAASYVDRNTAVLSAGRTKTTQASLSCCCCALDAVIRGDSRLHRCAPAGPSLRLLVYRPCSGTGCLPGTCRWYYSRGYRHFCWDSVSLATQPSLFFFSPLSVSPDSHPAQPLRLRVKFVNTQEASRSWLMTQVVCLKVNILPVSVCQ